MFFHYLIIAFFVFFFEFIHWLEKEEFPFAKVICWTIFWPIYFIKLILPKVVYFIVDVLNTFIDDIVGEYL